MHQTSINGLESLWMLGKVSRKKAQEQLGYRIVFFCKFYTRQDDISVRADRIRLNGQEVCDFTQNASPRAVPYP